MKTLLLLGFESKDMVGGDLLKLYERYGADITLKPIYPKTREEHRKLCSDSEVIAVVVQHMRFPIVPYALTLRAVPHITFYTERVTTAEERRLCQITSVQISLVDLPEKMTQEIQAA